MERWSQNTPMVVTARVYYVFRGCLASPFLKWIQWRLQRYLKWSTSHKILHVTLTELHKYFDLGLGLGRQWQSFSKFVRCLVAGSVIFYRIFRKVRMRSWSAGAIAILMYVWGWTNNNSLYNIWAWLRWCVAILEDILFMTLREDMTEQTMISI